MKAAIIAALAALLVASVALFVLRLPGPLRVGVLLPLTGPEAAVGLGMRNSIRLAADEVNERGGIEGRKLELVELDDASTPGQAVAGAKKLADDKRVVAALVHLDHDCSAATLGTFKEAGLPNLLAGVSTSEELEGRSNETQFRLLPYGEVQLKAGADYAWNVLGARKLLFARDDSHLGAATLGELHNAMGLVRNTLMVSSDAIVSPEDTDFGALLARVAAEKPDYVVFAGRPRQSGTLLARLRAAGYTGWFQSASHYPAQEFIAAAGGAAEGALQVFHGLPPEESAAGKAYLDAYAKHGFEQPPGSYGIYAYAEAQALFAAMGKSFLSRPSIAGALHHEALPTVFGPLRFIYIGSTYSTTAIYKVVQGRWVPIQVTDKDGHLAAYPRP